jgi:hypothetical protein
VTLGIRSVFQTKSILGALHIIAAPYQFGSTVSGPWGGRLRHAVHLARSRVTIHTTQHIGPQRLHLPSGLQERVQSRPNHLSHSHPHLPSLKPSPFPLPRLVGSPAFDTKISCLARFFSLAHHHGSSTHTLAPLTAA